MQVDHVRNDFVQIPSSTSVQEGGSFSVAEGVNFGFSRTFDDAGPPPGTPVFFFQGILGRSRPEIGRLHRKCGRTQFWCRLTHGGLKVPASRVVATIEGATLRDLPGSFDEVQLARVGRQEQSRRAGIAWLAGLLRQRKITQCQWFSAICSWKTYSGGCFTGL